MQRPEAGHSIKPVQSASLVQACMVLATLCAHEAGVVRCVTTQLDSFVLQAPPLAAISAAANAAANNSLLGGWACESFGAFMVVLSLKRREVSEDLPSLRPRRSSNQTGDPARDRDRAARA